MTVELRKKISKINLWVIGITFLLSFIPNWGDLRLLFLPLLLLNIFLELPDKKGEEKEEAKMFLTGMGILMVITIGLMIFIK